VYYGVKKKEEKQKRWLKAFAVPFAVRDLSFSLVSFQMSLADRPSVQFGRADSAEAFSRWDISFREGSFPVPM
jgi:hypothetical protein